MKPKYFIPYYGVHLAFKDNELSVGQFCILALMNINISTMLTLSIIQQVTQ